MNLPEPIAQATKPLFDVLPLDAAMEALVVTDSAPPSHVALVESIVAVPAIAAKPALCAALWLYADELDRSHVISQGIPDATGSFWHGIMHRREGDFGNSHYWFHKVGDHPVTREIPDYDPHTFIDEVERRYRGDAPDLVALQRCEWETLFAWCAA